MIPAPDIPDDDPRAAIITAMERDFGTCVRSYAQIEYLLGDILWHGWTLTEYAALRRPLPFGLQNRIDQLEKVLVSPGPFSPYARDLRLIVDRLKVLETGRHFFVHGYATFYWTPRGEAAMLWRRFVPPPKGGEATKAEMLVSPRHLADAAWTWMVFSATAQRQIREMYLELKLEDPTAR